MTILTDRQIRMLAERGMIVPFVPRKIRERQLPEFRREWLADGKTLSNFICATCGYDLGHGDATRTGCPTCGDDYEFGPCVSYGLSSMGYDLRVADEYKVFTPVHNTIVDPKNLDPDAFITVSGQGHVVIPPNSFALSYSVERFDLPDDILILVSGKSTYARCGIVTALTPGEPGWRGHLTIEISNTAPLPAKIYSGEGLCQALFFRADAPCDVPYGDDGRYQDQAPQVVLPSRIPSFRSTPYVKPV